jgi:biotin synthase-related radical SAM superfamily protein
MAASYHCCVKSRNYKIRLESFEGEKLRENEKGKKKHVERYREHSEN